MGDQYSYGKSDYWGEGHWIIQTFGRTMGRASKNDDGAWDAFVEYLPPSGEKYKPIAVNLGSIHDVYLALKAEWDKRDEAKAKKRGMATGPLPSGWHRVTWEEDGQFRYVVTEDIVSQVMVMSALEGKHSAKNVKYESWDNYPASTFPTIEIKEK